MKIFRITSIFIILFFVISCDKEETFPELDYFTIYYEAGSSWVNSFYSAEIDQDGNMTVEEQAAFKEYYRLTSYVLPGDDILLLKEKLERIINMDLADQYGFGNNPPIEDLPVKLLKYTSPLKSDSTAYYFPVDNEIPARLSTFMETLHEVIDRNDTLRNQ